MITLADYFGPWLGHLGATNDRVNNAELFLEKVNRLLSAYGRGVPINPVTKTGIAGKEFGGFRPQSCKQGAPRSSHKDGRGVDIYDPREELDGWLTDDILEAYSLYREHPDATSKGYRGASDSWCHLTDRPPPSGKRTFWP